MPVSKRLTAAITTANVQGRPALVPFITAGYPEPGEFINTLREVAEVGDVVEIGIPFSDPMADGMTIQRSSFVALQNGVSLRWIFDELEMTGDLSTPLVMMSYLNPLLAYGYEKLARRARATGVCAFIVPDLPFEECDELRRALESEGLGLIQLVTPATPDDRLKTLVAASRGFVYAVTITGITGGDTGLPDDLAEYLDKVSSVSKLPVCAGFGIRNSADVENVGSHAAGAIVGSALVEVLESGDDPRPFLRALGGK
ncbi:MAG: tryptophan synthase subunit alpha [Gammaproteobacteria bacterium]|jgi:tryptophan synthase alpha chain|nr:tryptophan synthase subunit alpha [Gammaproteobacteria bacterium]MDH3749306.1 tryptophan synthase subunit alpha [Gammaproteobacteria bacterium]MDH3804095.1 tryptophan synthase subunit alpha [Gammaproteobacteria bacterium]